MANEFKGMKKLDLLIMAFAWADRDYFLYRQFARQQVVINRKSTKWAIEIPAYVRLTEKSVFDMGVAELKAAITTYFEHVKVMEKVIHNNNYVLAKIGYYERQGNEVPNEVML